MPRTFRSSALFGSGVFENLQRQGGADSRATSCRPDWSPATDKTPTVWECVQHTARVLARRGRRRRGGGAARRRDGVAAPRPPALSPTASSRSRSKKGWAAEALVYNELAQEWPQLEDLAPALRRSRHGPGR